MSGRNPLMRPVFASLFLAAIAIASLGWSHMHSRALMGHLELTSGRNHFAVTLDFPPESFHVTRLQAIGRVIEVRGRTVYMMDVEPAEMESFAGYYWVHEVTKWPGR